MLGWLREVKIHEFVSNFYNNSEITSNISFQTRRSAYSITKTPKLQIPKDLELWTPIPDSLEFEALESTDKSFVGVSILVFIQCSGGMLRNGHQFPF